MRLGRGGLGRSLAAALRDLEDPEPIVRAAAATDLGRHAAVHPEKVVEPLVKALADDYPTVRAAAAMALADCGAKEGASERSGGGSHDVVEPLLERISDDDARVRQQALTALGEIGDGRASELVAEALTDEAPAVRFQAVIAYVRVCPHRDRVVEALLAASNDEDPLVCHIALRMAEELGSGTGDNVKGAAVDPELVDRAVALLDHDSDILRVVGAIIAGRSGRDDGRDILVAVALGQLVTSEADDEFAAIELCGQLGLVDALPGLERRAFAGLLNRDRFAWPARVALAALGHPQAIAWILKELDAWTYARRTVAVAAAGRARLEQARPQLEAMRGKSSRADQDAIREALASLDAQPDRA